MGDLRKKVALILGAALALLLVIWLAVAVFSRSGEEAKPSESSPSSESGDSETAAPATPPKEERVKASSEAAKQEVLAQAVAVLRSGVEMGSAAEDYGRLLEDLQAGDFSSVPKKLSRSIRFADFMATKELRGTTYVALVHLSTLLQTTVESREGELITPVAENAWKHVFVDLQAGQAFVPMTVFLGPEASFSLEFAYVEGEWKLTPYSLIDAIQAAERSSTASAAPPGS